jgi:hypothetical protein
MKSYSVHWINIVVIGVGLFILSTVTVQQIIDPAYPTGGIRYYPSALTWYLTAYCLYKFLTTAYRISFFEDGSIKLDSLIRRTRINTREIIIIRSNMMLVEIVTRRGSFYVSTLMDGTSNIKQVLLSLVKDTTETGEAAHIEPIQIMDRYRIFKICFAIILIVIAVLVELQQVRLRLK